MKNIIIKQTSNPAPINPAGWGVFRGAVGESRPPILCKAESALSILDITVLVDSDELSTKKNKNVSRETFLMNSEKPFYHIQYEYYGVPFNPRNCGRSSIR